MARKLKKTSNKRQDIVEDVQNDGKSFMRVVLLENRIPKRRVFLADVIRDERDREVLDTELRKREYKGKLHCITTIKHYKPVDDSWLTEFKIEVEL